MCMSLSSLQRRALNVLKRAKPELFYAVLSGFGQFGIITRARIALEPAPENENPVGERFDYFEVGQRLPYFVLEVAKYLSKSTEGTVLKGVEIKDKDQHVSTTDEELGPIVSYGSPRVGPSGEEASLLSKRTEQEKTTLKNKKVMASKLILISFFCHFISTFVLALDLTKFHSNICVDPSDIKAVSHDFGNISHVESLAVLYPSSADDIVYLVKRAYRSAKGFSVSARGNGHSIHGQAQAANGVVIDMRGAKATQLERRKPVQSPMGSYVDVWGGDLWINVLNWTLPHGLAPKSWTNYLYLTVGGTLSNAGIGGQTQGRSHNMFKRAKPKLFYGVLGGLGQFGIITRARIALEAAPESVVWIRLTYDDFSVFTKDQEYLISLHEKPASERFDLVLGYFNLNQSRIDYELEVVKYFSKSTDDAVNKEIDVLLAKLNFIPSSITRTSVSYFTFLNRLRQSEFNLRAQGLWNLPHPWLNLLIPKSRIADFDKGVFRGIVGNNSHGKVLVYPVNKNK
ncbi:hypothetical protein GIB67_035084 [Kingdonia uniflora]|uniref:cytokinin dehydrogenase n=1 Tax=Kingdonia uniflora TaxID=39325 RepID=A0A7J7P7A0_9MAGN|nr:hypothetical protein GIB67_035084 [Kingdonia uniflora]